MLENDQTWLWGQNLNTVATLFRMNDTMVYYNIFYNTDRPNNSGVFESSSWVANRHTAIIHIIITL